MDAIIHFPNTMQDSSSVTLVETLYATIYAYGVGYDYDSDFHYGGPATASVQCTKPWQLCIVDIKSNYGTDSRTTFASCFIRDINRAIGTSHLINMSYSTVIWKVAISCSFTSNTVSFSRSLYQSEAGSGVYMDSQWNFTVYFYS